MNEPMLSIILSASVLGGPEWDSKVRGVWDLAQYFPIVGDLKPRVSVEGLSG